MYLSLSPISIKTPYPTPTLSRISSTSSPTHSFTNSFIHSLTQTTKANYQKPIKMKFSMILAALPVALAATTGPLNAKKMYARDAAMVAARDAGCDKWVSF
jgi:hypothetical protein